MNKGFEHEVTGDDWGGILHPGERILWQGRPDGRIVFTRGTFALVGFGLAFSGFAAVWMSLASMAGGFFWAFGIPLNPLTVALGSLTAAVGCEFTVMTCDAVRTRDPRLRTAVTLAALTSGTGFAVLALSDLALMREFGLLLALSVLLSYLAARLVVRAFPPAHGTAGTPGGGGDPSTPAREKLVGVM